MQIDISSYHSTALENIYPIWLSITSNNGVIERAMGLVQPWNNLSAITSSHQGHPNSAQLHILKFTSNLSGIRKKSPTKSKDTADI